MVPPCPVGYPRRHVTSLQEISPSRGGRKHDTCVYAALLDPDVRETPEKPIAVRVEVVNAVVVPRPSDAEADDSDRLLLPNDLGLFNQEFAPLGGIELAALPLVERVPILV